MHSVITIMACYVINRTPHMDMLYSYPYASQYDEPAATAVGDFVKLGLPSTPHDRNTTLKTLLLSLVR